MVREITNAAVRVSLSAIRIPIDAALGIARTALGDGRGEPQGAEVSPGRKRATPAKATPPRKRPAPKRTAKAKKAKAKPKAAPDQAKQPRQAKPGEAVSGFPEPPGKDPGDVSKDPTPHHALANPVDDPDPSEGPDPYESRDDPRDPLDPDANETPLVASEGHDRDVV